MISKFERFSTAISFINRCIQKIEREEMAKYGLKGPHAECLLVLNQYPDGITAAKLCEVSDKDKAAISRTLAELEEAEMIIREDPDGKRYRAMLKLTEKGRKIAADVNYLMSLAVAKAISGVEYSQGEAFFKVLKLIVENIDDICRNGIRSEQ